MSAFENHISLLLAQTAPFAGLKALIQREAARLTDMVEELLEFTRLQDGRFTLNVVPCDLRTEFEVGNPSAVLDGEIDGFIEAGIRWRRSQETAAK